MDQRIGLKNDTTINFDNGKEIRVTGEIGRGASCIVYDAVTFDDIGVQHFVRIKECYPNNLSIHRDGNNHLVPSEHHRSKFETARKNFVNAYRRNANIRNTLGMINSTINPTEITSCNDTVYIKMELDEGMDYMKYKDRSLKALFTHIKSLAELIQKYHQKGYLYLDIKPQNIFIIPETDEHVILFDFDSVITLEELEKNPKIELSYSKDFSPPEQVQGQAGKIGKHTDIYSIGALAFYKLFDRAANPSECKISGTYPFEEMNYANGKYRPQLYRALDTFFKKTLSIAIAPRWHDMQQVIDHLDQLIKLSDIDEVYLLDSFQYDSACFVGRKEELQEITDILATNQLVFLSGIGGIGKTELAKQYANKYRSQYDTVTFSAFEKDIETLVRDEILIHKIKQDEGESDSDYFERKIRILKQITTPKDLIIIDNFDMDSDEKLEVLFRCPCKFIVTTRMDFRDYNYKQVRVDKLQGFGDLLELFYTYNNKDYQGEESEAVEKLIDYVDHHTMVVELIAKYLRNSEELPTQLYGKFLQVEGSTNTGEVNVKQRKDFHLRSESVNGHLRILFQVSAFDRTEQEIIRSLSLLAGIRIQKSSFHALCAVDDGENKLGILIRNGWVEYYEATGKISLHQVIQDLVYKELAPNAENCPCIVDGMEKYVGLKTLSRTEGKIRDKLFKIFMERLSGNNIPYAKLCLKYGEEKKLDEAEKICLNHDKHGTEVFDLLQRIYREKIRIISVHIDSDSLIDPDEIALDRKQKLSMIDTLLDHVKLYCKKSSRQPDYIVKEYIETGIEIHCLLSFNMYISPTTRIPELDHIYKKIIKMFDIAAKQLPSTSFSKEKKLELYKELQDFYMNNYPGSLYSDYVNEYFSDMEKASQYQEFIEQLEDSISSESAAGEDTQKVVDIRKLTQTEMWRYGFDAEAIFERKGKYWKAISYYKKQLKKDCGIYKKAIQGIARTYFKIGNTHAAIASLKQLIANGKKQGVCSHTAYVELIKSLAKHKDLKNAVKYAKELIYYVKPDALSGNDSNSVIYAIFSYYFLYTAEKSQDKKDKLWQKCLKYYKILDDYMIGEEIYDFIIEYLSRNETDYEEIANILDRLPASCKTGFKTCKKIILQSIKTNAGKKEFEKYHVQFLVRLAEDNFYESSITKQKYCNDAEKFYSKYNLNDKYIQSRIYQIKAELLMEHMNYDEYDKIVKIKKLCDYKLLAERDICDNHCTEKEQVQIWKTAASEYQFTSNYKTMLVCLRRALEILERTLDKDNYYDYEEVISDFFYAYKEMEDFDSAYHIIMESYKRAIEYLTETNPYHHMTNDTLAEDKYMDKLDNAGDENWKDEINTDEENIYGSDRIYMVANHLENISGYLAQISRFDDAIRTYFTAMYFVLIPEIDTRQLKIGNNAEADIIQICKTVNTLLDQELNSGQIDVLVRLKDEILECKDSNLIGAEIIRSIITKISKKYQYKNVEFKR